MYGYKCEYCDGTVWERKVDREAFKHRDVFVILKDVPVGVCDKCGFRTYHSSLQRRVQEIAFKIESPTRIEQVPVATFA